MIGRILRRILGERTAEILYRLIGETAWPFRYHYALAFVLMAIVSGMFAAVALLMRDVFNEIFIAQDPEALRWIAVLVLIILTTRGLAMYGQAVILARISNRIIADLQSRLYAHIVGQGLIFHTEQSTGDLAMRLTGNCQSASLVLQTLATRLGVDLMSVIGLVAVMFWNDVTMSLIALIGLPAVFGGVAWLIKRVKRLAREQVHLSARILNIANETTLGMRVIRAFNLQDMMRERTEVVIEGVRERSDKLAVLQAVPNPLMEVVAGLGAGAVLLYAGWRIIEGEMEVGALVSFLFALFAVGDPARRLAQIIVTLRQQMVGVELIYETLDTDRRTPERPDAIDQKIQTGDVAFRNVTFSYGDEQVLHDMSFHAKGGKVTALVGPSGGGKSTILALIERFFDPSNGQILIDGKNIADVSLSSLHANIAFVPQESFLFGDTVAENIRFGRQDATRAEIEAAAREANAHDFIAALPQGYDTLIGEHGSSLSGGQRQRIAIARAMLRDAQILLLDEATSALDAESEARVQEALERLMQNRTTLVIAHRLATIRRADQILVIDSGRIVEAGTHKSLLAADGLYSRLAKLQFGAPD